MKTTTSSSSRNRAARSCRVTRLATGRCRRRSRTISSRSTRSPEPCFWASCTGWTARSAGLWSSPARRRRCRGRTSKALSRLNDMFRLGQVHKTYWAIVATPSQGRGDGGQAVMDGQWHELEHWLVRNEQQNKSYAYDHEVPRSKHAVLRYRPIGRSERYTLLEVQLLTGRHHQIRCQLAAMGWQHLVAVASRGVRPPCVERTHNGRGPAARRPAVGGVWREDVRGKMEDVRCKK